MRLIPIDDLSTEEFTIADAVQNECDAELPDSGITESTAENHTALSRVVGILVQSLYEQCLIDEVTLFQDILQNGYQAKKE